MSKFCVMTRNAQIQNSFFSGAKETASTPVYLVNSRVFFTKTKLIVWSDFFVVDYRKNTPKQKSIQHFSKKNKRE